MPEGPKKRGRPRKYDTPEEKARQDVIAKRARRRLRDSSVHGDIRFQVYVPQPIEALPPSSSPQGRPESTSYLNVLANTTSRSDRAETPLPRALNHITSDIIPRRTIETGSNSPSPLGEAVLSSCVMGPCGDQCYSTGDDNTYKTSDLQLHYTTISSSSERESTSGFLPERTSAPPDPDTHRAVENDAGRIREDKNTTYQEEGIGDGLLSDVEPQSEDAFESVSSPESDVSDAQSEMDMDDTSIPSKSDLYLANGFLERNWGHLCDCQGEEEEEEENVSWDEQPGLGLKDMADYWQNLTVPDAISTASPQAGTDKNEQDINSIISWASYLSINRGLYISYYPPTSRNFRSSIYIFHQETALHLIPHLQLGSRRQSPQFGYYPRSFNNIESKAYSCQRETYRGMVPNRIDIYYYLS
ncbi:hypothetical protein BKA56DRAFT_638218 [Ilyonectria sp. MPI-CAGE-AT-0026]|nr:hypothetical protein BKA56DRAFT_638218 [Ilyonectria sp. MPI-CAGE-AT-0026]